MKKTSLLSQCLSAGILAFSFATLHSEVAQAQRPINLLDLQCVRTRSNNFYNELKDIVVARQLYTSNLNMRPDNAWTCKLPGGPATFRAEWTVPDTSNAPPAKIEVYVNGSQVASQTGGGGKINTMLVDVSNGSNISFEIFCARAENCGGYYYFLKLQIEPGGTSPGSRSQDYRLPDSQLPYGQSPYGQSPDRRSPEPQSPDRRSPEQESPDQLSPIIDSFVNSVMKKIFGQ